MPPEELLPRLLDQLLALGDMAREIKARLGGNGHRPEEAEALFRKGG